MKTKLLFAYAMLCISTFSLAQVIQSSLPNSGSKIAALADIQADLTLSETGPISACDVRELSMEAYFEADNVVRVQFDYTKDGSQWQTAGLDAEGRDGYTAHMAVTSLPEGNYTIVATAFLRNGTVARASREINIFNAIAAPYWVAPANLENEVNDDELYLEVTQDVDTSNWVSLKYAYSTDGINWKEIAKLDGGEWGHTWDLSQIEPNGFIVRASVNDKSGNEVNTFRRVARTYKSDFFSAVPVGAVSLKNFIDENGNEVPDTLPEEQGIEADLLVESLKGTFNYGIKVDDLLNAPMGQMRAKLFLDPLNDDAVYTNEVQINVGQDPSFNVDGLPAGDYRAVVLLIYNSGAGSCTVRSEINTLVALKDTGANFGASEWATGLLDGLIGKTGGHGSASISLKRDGVSVDAISNTVTKPGLKTTMLGSGFARLNGDTYLSFLVVNTGNTFVNDLLTFAAYSWDAFGDPIQNETQAFPIALEPGESTNIVLVTDGNYGNVKEFAGFAAEMEGDTASVTGFGFAGINEETDVLEEISLEIGDGQVAFEPFDLVTDYEMKAGFPEYHWVKCKRVRITQPASADPAANYSTTIVNRPGGTTVIPKKCPVLHAGIIGGPHSVRTTCISKDGTTKVYGSEHYVHKSIKRITIKPKSSSGGNKNQTGEIIPTLEYECGRTLVGLTGPGGELTHTTGISVEVSTSVTSTISGTIGKEGVASIGSSVGVTAGQKVTRTETTSYKKEIPEGECAILKERLCYKVWRGEIEVEFDDGTTITGDFEAKELDSVGYEQVPKKCK